jgi:hypothetical protein
VYEVAKSSKFVDIIKAALSLETLTTDIRVVRIHESGDFFSQDYLDAWIKISKAFPDVMFYTYTKSYMLDFNKALKLPNLNIRYSIDPTTRHYPKQKMSQALVSWYKPDSYITCPSVLSKKHEIKCIRDCRICIDTHKDIHFPPHGIFKKHLDRYESHKVN